MRPIKLVTARQLRRLQANWRQLEDARRTGAAFDPIPMVKLFTPDANATWLIAAIDWQARLAWGLCDLGLGYVETGLIDLDELRALRGPMRLPIERDRWFSADQTLSSYCQTSMSRGGLVT